MGVALFAARPRRSAPPRANTATDSSAAPTPTPRRRSRLPKWPRTRMPAPTSTPATPTATPTSATTRRPRAVAYLPAASALGIAAAGFLMTYQAMQQFGA